VRDPQHRQNYAVLTPHAFAQPAPLAYQSWHILLREQGALARCESPQTGITFPKSAFDVASRLH
jgi:hypothetical protein